ncbi:MAG: GDP-mannose mannosyl hydrolase [Thiomicrospira sp.]|nr:MAG: GDP-mannose mannosyl hydrolase [Thiomicrospira sp.]
MLSLEDFSNLIENGPLISIDLVIEMDSGFLLGKRTNRPAKGYWFVPGGRVYKNEPLTGAIERIAYKEINEHLSIKELEFLGVFEHFYADSFISEELSTHYVVLAYKVRLASGPLSLPMIEHNEYRLFTRDEILEDDWVHEHTKQYFYSKGVI